MALIRRVVYTFPMKTKVAILILIIAVSLIAVFVLKSSTPMDKKNPISQDGGTAAAPRSAKPGKNFDTIHPDSWEYKAQAEKIINMPGNGPGTEQIVYGVVQRPSQDGTESTVYYFATHSAIYLPPPADTGDLFNAIYAYDVSDNTWERVFKRQSSYNFDAPQPGDIQTFHVLGFDNERLIVQIMADDIITKNPYDLWSVPFEEVKGPSGTYTKSSGLVTIDLAEPYSKRPPYER